MFSIRVTSKQAKPGQLLPNPVESLRCCQTCAASTLLILDTQKAEQLRYKEDLSRQWEWVTDYSATTAIMWEIKDNRSKKQRWQRSSLDFHKTRILQQPDEPGCFRLYFQQAVFTVSEESENNNYNLVLMQWLFTLCFCLYWLDVWRYSVFINLNDDGSRLFQFRTNIRKT